MADTMSKISKKMAIRSNQCAWPEMFAAATKGGECVDVPLKTIDTFEHCRPELIEGGFTLSDYTQTLPIAGLLRTQQRTHISWKNVAPPSS